MNGRVIRAIVMKDLREFSRNRFWFFAMLIAVAIMTAVFWLIPVQHPRHRLKVGVYPRQVANAANATLALAKLGRFGEQGAALAKAVEFVPLADADRVRAIVSHKPGDGWHGVAAAIVFSDDFAEAVRDGRTPTVSLYLDHGLPDELKATVAVCVREAVHALRASAAGGTLTRSLPVSLPDLDSVTLGIDLRGGHIPPGLGVRAVMLGTMAAFSAVLLAWLIASEFELGTMTALLVTPAGVGEILVAKAITGVILCMGQSLFYMLATLRFEENWPLTLPFLLLGALMMSAIGMIAGSIGKGFADTLIWALLITVPLGLPLLSSISGPSTFVKAMPSYGITKGMTDMAFYGQGWSELAPYACMGLAWDVVLLCLACVVLKRRVQAR